MISLPKGDSSAAWAIFASVAAAMLYRAGAVCEKQDIAKDASEIADQLLKQWHKRFQDQ